MRLPGLPFRFLGLEIEEHQRAWTCCVYCAIKTRRQCTAERYSFTGEGSSPLHAFVNGILLAGREARLTRQFSEGPHSLGGYY